MSTGHAVANVAEMYKADALIHLSIIPSSNRKEQVGRLALPQPFPTVRHVDKGSSNAGSFTDACPHTERMTIYTCM